MTRPRNKGTFARLLAAIAVLCSACAMVSALGGCARAKQQLPIAADSISVPYQIFNKASLLFYDGAVRKWKLDALHMRKELDGRGNVSVAPVRLTIYDTLGEKASTVVADSGTTNTGMENFRLWGNVVINTDDHKIIKTQRLLWNKLSHRVNSDTYVQIQTSDGVTMRGKGLDAHEDFSQWSFKSNFTGEIPNFKDRMEGEDQLF